MTTAFESWTLKRWITILAGLGLGVLALALPQPAARAALLLAAVLLILWLPLSHFAQRRRVRNWVEYVQEMNKQMSSLDAEAIIEQIARESPSNAELQGCDDASVSSRSSTGSGHATTVAD